MSLASNDFDNFEEIILNTPFQELSQQELSDLGLEGITAEEFEQVRQTWNAIKELEPEVEIPSVSIKDKLLDAFDQGPSKEAKIIPWPFWLSIGLSSAALVVLAFFLYNPKNEVQNSLEVAQQLKPVESSSSKEKPLNLTSPNEIESVKEQDKHIQVPVPDLMEMEVTETEKNEIVEDMPAAKEVISIEENQLSSDAVVMPLNSMKESEIVPASTYTTTTFAQSESVKFVTGVNSTSIVQNIQTTGATSLAMLPDWESITVTVY